MTVIVVEEQKKHIQENKEAFNIMRKYIMLYSILYYTHYGTLMVKRLSCLPSKQAAGVRLPFSVFFLLLLFMLLRGFWSRQLQVRFFHKPSGIQNSTNLPRYFCLLVDFT